MIILSLDLRQRHGEVIMKAKFHPFAVVAALAELLSLFLLHQIPNCCENIKGRMV